MASVERPKTHRGRVTVALLLSMFMIAIEITIVATAMPRIVADLGGFALLSWVFSAYLLTQVVSIPIYGKLADLYGRKPVFLSGIMLFLIASVLCGQSQTMVQLIAFRFLQGLGGGAVQPIAVTIIGDLYQPHERHKVQGWTGSVFGISSLIGPTLGAVIVDWAHWSWIFYLNVPLGFFAILLILRYFHEKKRVRDHRIDFAGALLLVAATSVLMLGLLEGGTAWPWLSWQSLVCIGIFIFLSTLLIKLESRVPEPILPLWIFKHRLINIAGIATFLNGAIIIGYSAMIPTHVQGVLGGSALVAGLTLAVMSIGWPLASFFSGHVINRIGFRNAAITGSTALLIGSLAVLGSAHNSAVGIGAALFVVGMGLGLQSTAYIVTIQSTVSWQERGVATANNLFMRTLGSTVGVAAFGGILNSSISKYLSQSQLNVSGHQGMDMVNQLLSPDSSHLGELSRNTVIKALGSGMTAVFIAAVVIALVCLMITLVLPSQVELRTQPGHAR